MSRSFEILGLEVIPVYSPDLPPGEEVTLPDVVLSINFRYGENENTILGNCQLNPPEKNSSFLPLESITKEVAMGWLLDCNKLNKQGLDQKLDLLIASGKDPVFEYDWNTPAEPEAQAEPPAEG